MSHLTIDMRLVGASGIGRYLTRVVPGVIRSGDFRATLLVGETGAAADRNSPPFPVDAATVECGAPIYSIAEQYQIPRSVPKDTDLYWSPHYNLPLGYRGRLVVTIHDALHLARPEFVRGWHQRLYAWGMFRAAVRRPGIVLCDSAFTADELVRHAGADRRKLRVVHLGVDARWFDAVSDGLDPLASRPYLLFVGNVKPHKNLTGLLRAFGSIMSRIPHDLVIVGKKEGFITGDPAAAALADQMDGRVRFIGLVEDRRLRDLMAGASAFVFPSLYEGFGLPPLEAMAAGCPTIVSNAASLPEVCGDAALYCDPRNPQDIARQVERVLTESALREEMIGRGLERAKGFTWERCVEHTSAAVAEALG